MDFDMNKEIFSKLFGAPLFKRFLLMKGKPAYIPQEKNSLDLNLKLLSALS